MTSRSKRAAAARERQGAPGRTAGPAKGTTSDRAGSNSPLGRLPSRWPIYVGGLVIALVLASVAGGIFGGMTQTPAPSTPGTIVQGNGGHWTNITPNTLAAKLASKDFTLLNVKTPYIGEIAGTDLYIPYTDLVTRKSELPADKAAPIVVYCRSGAESAAAAQTLLALGYTNILNLDGGMNAWTASGRALVQLNRS
jgi:rhodanese-related sulfurtransferase